MNVSGMNTVAMTVRTFMTVFSWFETIDRCASSRLLIRSWKNIDSSAMPHEVIVDVAEPVGNLFVDERKLAAGEPADDVALRLHDAAQRGDVALEVEDLASQTRLGALEHLFLDRVEPGVELVDLRPIGVDHQVDDAVHQRRRPLAERHGVLGTDLLNAVDRARVAAVNRDEVA